MIDSLLAYPCLACYDLNICCYLSTDFSAIGFGYSLTHPSCNMVLLGAMNREIAGGIYDIMDHMSKAKLPPVVFNSRRARGWESKLHSHLGEGFCGDWAINKNRSRLWARRFTWITDCYALWFILSCDGTNPVLLHLQMRLMLWYVDIVHHQAY